MIKLRFIIPPGFANPSSDIPPTVECKSISAAWNEIRKMRDTFDTAFIQDAVLEVTLPKGETSDRIPRLILFRPNTKGKIEFKDYEKVQAKVAKKEEKTQEKAADSKTKKLPSAMEIFGKVIPIVD